MSTPVSMTDSFVSSRNSRYFGAMRSKCSPSLEQASDVEAGVARAAGQRRDDGLHGRVRRAERERRQAGVDDVGAGVDGAEQRHVGHPAREVRVHHDRDRQVLLQPPDQLRRIVGREQAGHVLDAEAVGAHPLERLRLGDEVVEREHRPAERPLGHRVADGPLDVLAGLLDGLERGGEVAFVVERVEDAEHVDAAPGRVGDERFHHVVCVIAVADQVLAAEEHLQPDVRHQALEGADPVPRVLVEEPRHHVEGGAAPDLHRPEAGVVHPRGDGGEVVGPDPGGEQRLVAVTEGEVGDEQAHAEENTISCSPHSPASQCAASAPHTLDPTAARRIADRP